MNLIKVIFFLKTNAKKSLKYILKNHLQFITETLLAFCHIFNDNNVRGLVRTKYSRFLTVNTHNSNVDDG